MRVPSEGQSGLTEEWNDGVMEEWMRNGNELRVAVYWVAWVDWVT